MELVEIKPTKKNGLRAGVLMLRVDHVEALRLIESLVQQMQDRSPNRRRWENFLKDGRDFSIAVHTNV